MCCKNDHLLGPIWSTGYVKINGRDVITPSEVSGPMADGSWMHGYAFIVLQLDSQYNVVKRTMYAGYYAAAGKILSGAQMKQDMAALPAGTLVIIQTADATAGSGSSPDDIKAAMGVFTAPLFFKSYDSNSLRTSYCGLLVKGSAALSESSSTGYGSATTMNYVAQVPFVSAIATAPTAAPTFTLSVTATHYPSPPPTPLQPSSQVTIADAAVLCDFYASVTNKAKLTNWCGAKNADGSYVNGPCSTGSAWSGVECSVAGGVNRVTSINLAGVGLGGGNIPSTIGNLNALTLLSLGRNSLSGTIPSTIGNLNALIRLDLALNSLSGTIPSTIGNLNALGNLYLDTNSLSGTIPSTIGNLKALYALGLSANSLSGTIPSTIGNLNALTILNLDTNSLSGNIPSTIGNLNALGYLYLVANSLSGAVPASFCGLKSTIHLRIQNNPLLTCYPSCLNSLTTFFKDATCVGSSFCLAYCSGSASDPFICPVRQATAAQLTVQVVAVDVDGGKKIASFSEETLKNAQAASAPIPNVVIPELPPTLVAATQPVVRVLAANVSKPLATPEQSAATSARGMSSQAVVEATAQAMQAANIPVKNTELGNLVVVPLQINLEGSCFQSIDFRQSLEMSESSLIMYKAITQMILEEFNTTILYDAEMKKNGTLPGAMVALAAIFKAHREKTPAQIAQDASKMRMRVTQLYGRGNQAADSSSNGQNNYATQRNLASRSTLRPTARATAFPTPGGVVQGVILEFNVTMSINLLIIASSGGVQYTRDGAHTVSNDDQVTKDAGAGAGASYGGDVTGGSVGTETSSNSSMNDSTSAMSFYRRILAKAKNSLKPTKPPVRATTRNPTPSPSAIQTPQPSVQPTGKLPQPEIAAAMAESAIRKGAKSTRIILEQNAKFQNMQEKDEAARDRELQASGKISKFRQCLSGTDSFKVIGAGASSKHFLLLNERLVAPTRAPTTTTNAPVVPRPPNSFTVSEVIRGIGLATWERNRKRMDSVFRRQVARALQLHMNSITITRLENGPAGSKGKKVNSVKVTFRVITPLQGLHVPSVKSAVSVIHTRLAKLATLLPQQRDFNRVVVERPVVTAAIDGSIVSSPVLRPKPSPVLRPTASSRTIAMAGFPTMVPYDGNIDPNSRGAGTGTAPPAGAASVGGRSRGSVKVPKMRTVSPTRIPPTRAPIAITTISSALPASPPTLPPEMLPSQQPSMPPQGASGRPGDQQQGADDYGGSNSDSSSKDKTSSNAEGGLSDGIVAAIAVGVAVLLLSIAAIVYFIQAKKKGNNQRQGMAKLGLLGTLHQSELDGTRRSSLSFSHGDVYVGRNVNSGNGDRGSHFLPHMTEPSDNRLRASMRLSSQSARASMPLEGERKIMGMEMRPLSPALRPVHSAMHEQAFIGNGRTRALQVNKAGAGK